MDALKNFTVDVMKLASDKKITLRAAYVALGEQVAFSIAEAKTPKRKGFLALVKQREKEAGCSGGTALIQITNECPRAFYRYLDRMNMTQAVRDRCK